MQRKTKIWIGIGVVVIIGIGAAVFSRPEEPQPRTTTLAPTTIVQDVSFTARLEAEQASHLGFAASGPVTELPVAEGQVVAEGAVLAEIDSRIASFDSAKARADRASAQSETLIAWEKAKLERDNTKVENDQKIEEQKQVVRDKKAELDQALSAWRTRADDEGEDSYLAKTAYSTYLAALSVYNGAQEDLTTLRKTVATSNDTASKAADLAREQHVATTQASGSVAGLSSLEALESRASIVLAQQTITAPFAGMVTDIDIDKGEYATAGVTVLRLETVDQLKIVGQVTETDAVKVMAGMTATVSFDALPPTQTWDATVSYIAPSAEIIEGVPVYDIELTFSMADETLKPGLTANVIVHTDSRDNVLAIPRRAVSTKNGSEFVIVIGEDGFEAEREVTTGLTGSDGTIEITSGLRAGEIVLVSRQPQE